MTGGGTGGSGTGGAALSGGSLRRAAAADLGTAGHPRSDSDPRLTTEVSIGGDWQRLASFETILARS